MDHVPTSPPRRWIVVDGTGRARVEPDEAVAELGVLVMRQTAVEARNDAAAQMGRVVTALRDNGVAERDLRTSSLSLSPTYEHRPDGTPRRVGYEVANRVTATVRAIDQLAGLVDAAIAAGATSLDGVAFRRADESAAEREALRSALATARAKAEAVAEAAGVGLGRVESVEEGGSITPHPGPRLMRMEAMAVADTPVMGGTVEIVRSVRVAFAIDDTAE
jgi:uncharacterized protein YggE